MLPVTFGIQGAPLQRVLAIGAHPDDIEIGCGGTLLALVAGRPALSVYWLVLSGKGERAAEAEAGAAAFLGPEVDREVVVLGFRDGFFPWSGAAIKEVFEELKPSFSPDLIFAPRLSDAHQDHRLVAELTWNTFRDHLILEYEIPKYEGDLGQPNLFVPLERAHCERKVELLLKHFPSQAGRDWFADQTFWSLLRLRGLESRAPSTFAEAFHARKLVL